MGTGLRFWGDAFGPGETVDVTAFVTHLHWDHIQGLPFFTPGHRAGSTVEIYGPTQDDGRSLGDAVDSFLRPPYFPVGISDLAGTFTFHELGDERRVFDGYEVTSRFVPHVGPTLGFRIDSEAGSVVYVSDHQQPDVSPEVVHEQVVELARGCDVLIHDGQYTPDEFAMKLDWGHCTIDYAIEVAARAEVKQLVLFHHDPSHDDQRMDELALGARRRAVDRGVADLVVASEGLELALPSGGRCC